jgi:hypothetical protein
VSKKKRHELTKGHPRVVPKRQDVEPDVVQQTRSAIYQSGVHLLESPYLMQIDLVCETPTSNAPAFSCDFRGCVKIYKRKGDLKRHQKKHDDKERFLCTAQGCTRKFTRNDKRTDHMRRGHDEDTLFACSKPGCHTVLTRDLLSLHDTSMFGHIASYRHCPLPKCGFHCHASSLEELQQHLMEKHEARGRKKSAHILADSGYDHRSAGVLCPICPVSNIFEKHVCFVEHFRTDHCQDPSTESVVAVGEWDDLRRVYLEGCEVFPNEVFERRRTVLRLWPGFKYHPLWDDLRAHCWWINPNRDD